jgi:hypothetical protein
VKVDSQQERFYRAYKEVEVFEEAEDAQIDRDADDEQQLPLLKTGGRVDSLADPKVQDGIEEKQEGEAPVPIAIEDVACDQKEDVLPPELQPGVDQQDDSNEYEEGQRIKKHLFLTYCDFEQIEKGKKQPREQPMVNDLWSTICRSEPSHFE